MAGTDRQGKLFADPATPEGVIVIDDRCLVRTQDEHRVVIVSGVVLAQYTVGDRMAEAHAMVMLVESGWADQNDVARAFGCSARTLRRDQHRFTDAGLAALGGGYPRGRARVAGKRLRVVRRLKEQAVSNREIARRLGVNEKAVRKLLRRVGWQEKLREQPSLPFKDAPQGADLTLSALCSSNGENDGTSKDSDESVIIKDAPVNADPNLSAFCPPDALPIWPVWAWWTTPPRYSVRLSAYRARGYCWPSRPWSTARRSTLPGAFTVASAPPSTGFAIRFWHCC